MTAAALAPQTRALVYLGFRFDDVSDDFDDELVERLGRAGRVITVQRLTGVTRAAIVDLAPARSSIMVNRSPPPVRDASGCISVRPAMRW